jgi:GT2 family glycosyltransferase
VIVSLSVLVIVLSYNGTRDTLECLGSLSRQTCRTIDVVVVDNASTDGAPAAIKAAFPDIELLSLPENLGWAGGNNKAIRLALDRNHQVACLLNNDTVLPDNAIETLLKAMEFIGPCLLHPAIDYYDPLLGAQLDPAAGRPPTLKATPVAAYPGLFEMEFAYGACILIHAEIFRRLGLIDERFFLQQEETDFCKRARAAGYKSYCDTNARILHKESLGFGGRITPVKTYYTVRNTLLLCEKHRKSLLEFFGVAKRLLWTMRNTAEYSNGPIRSWMGFLIWMFSRNAFARAARMGAGDYLLRRFGRLRDGRLL